MSHVIKHDIIVFRSDGSPTLHSVVIYLHACDTLKASLNLVQMNCFNLQRCGAVQMTVDEAHSHECVIITCVWRAGRM